MAPSAFLSAQPTDGYTGPLPDPSVEVLPDSSNFVTASLLVAEPTYSFYSAFGHAALRMQCPAYHLDYVFTFESDPNVGNFMTGIAGKAMAKYIPVPVDVYVGGMDQQERKVTEYVLNLTHHEKQHLWQLLDEDVAAGSYRNFNFLMANCVSTSLKTVEESLAGEHFEWGPIRHPMQLKDGDLLRYYCRNSSWMEFVLITFLGSIYDIYSPLAVRLTPNEAVPYLRKVSIVNDSTGEKRFVITDPGKVIVEHPLRNTDTRIIPTVVFSVLLLITLLLTILEWTRRLHKWLRVFDLLLFSLIAVIGCLLLFVTFYSELFGSTWNWYILPYNPLPLLVLLFDRQTQFGRYFWLVYSLVLVLFILATPFVGVLDVPHQLITAALLVRSVMQLFIRDKINLK
ncbi:MAG: DUF4105 domain-containing protein [Prevotella sp.]|nr:DUF4105 domain-containing protein [Prevotella sp.]